MIPGVLEATELPNDYVEWMRLATALSGLAAFGLLVYRLLSRWDRTTLLAKTLVSLLALAVLTLSLGAAEAERLGAPFNRLAFLALVVNLGSVVAGIFWIRWLDPVRRRP